jgi:CheY-like chemotaxis protein
VSYLLLVDDDVDGREPLRRFLKRSGYEVACASNGREALTSIFSRTPDLVLLDLFMPELDGVGLLEVLRSYLRLRSLPVVILTAYPEAALLRRAMRLNVFSILVKGAATLQETLATVNAELKRAPSPASGSHPPRMDA